MDWDEMGVGWSRRESRAEERRRRAGEEEEERRRMVFCKEGQGRRGRKGCELVAKELALGAAHGGRRGSCVLDGWAEASAERGGVACVCLVCSLYTSA